MKRATSDKMKSEIRNCAISRKELSAAEPQPKSRSVLECGSPLPLLDALTHRKRQRTAALQDASRRSGADKLFAACGQSGLLQCRGSAWFVFSAFIAPLWFLRRSVFGCGSAALGSLRLPRGPQDTLHRREGCLLPLPFRRGEGRGEGSLVVAYPAAPSVIVRFQISAFFRTSDFGLRTSDFLTCHPPHSHA